MPNVKAALISFGFFAYPLDFYIKNQPARHINIVYGDWKQEVRDLCKFTGIEVVEYSGR